ncbi:MAG: FixH family protein [Kofleriaceae bacterium]
MSPAARWTTAIVGLLGLCVAAMVTLAVVAGGTRGRLVVPDYDQRALHHGDVMAQRDRDRALGWHAGLAIDGDDVVVTVRDAGGQPVTGATVEVALYHRAAASTVLHVAPRAAGDGVYRGHVDGLRDGIHQLAATVRRGDATFTADGWAER